MSSASVVPHWGVLTVCVMLATIMQALDTTIANVALPYMQGSLSATTDQINWVLTSYIVAAAIMTPPTGATAPMAGVTARAISRAVARPVGAMARTSEGRRRNWRMNSDRSDKAASCKNAETAFIACR